jgi:capsular exopolysaccharide synthesis family protein
MDVRTYLRVVRQQWWLVVAAVLVAVGVAGVVTSRTPPQYAATVTFFVTTPNQRVGDAYQGGLFSQQRIKSYADLLTSERLAREVVAVGGAAQGLSPEQVRSRVTAQMQANTVLLSARVTDSDARRTGQLADIVAARFIALVETLETPPESNSPTVKIEVVGGPRLDPQPVSPRPIRNLTLAGLLGLLLGAGVALLRDVLNSSVRDGAMLQGLTGVPLLGQVPLDPDMESAPLVVGDAAYSSRAEALRKLRTNLRFVDAQGPARVLSVTSAVQGEGKSSTCCNLAISFAEAGYRVMLIDADLRRPMVASYMGLKSAAGLTNVLIGEVALQDVAQPWGDKSLVVLPAGSLPPNPSELLGSTRMTDLLDMASESADVVIIDTPPLLSVTDAAVIAVQADGALLVTRQSSTSRSQVTAAVQALRTVDARLLGCVVNMAAVSKKDAYYYSAYRVRSLVSDGGDWQPAPRAEEPITVGRQGRDVRPAAPAETVAEQLARIPR